MEFQIRELTWDDYPQACEVWLACFGKLKPEDEPDALRRTLERNPGTCLVAVLNGRVVGTTLGTTDGRRGFLYHVATHPEAQRRGVGAALVREACKRLRAMGITTVHLRVAAENEGARALYRSLGFSEDVPKVVGMRFPPDPMEH